jgi:hypothetical protein
MKIARATERLMTTLAVLLLVGAASVVLAVPPHAPQLVTNGNLWTITFYDDTNPLHSQWATQRICFFPAGVQGTHQLYGWVSISYPDWNGRATQEGDQIFMHGDFQWPYGNKDGGHDSMDWQLVTMSPGGEVGAVPKGEVGTGHWKEWVENGGLGFTIGWGNTLFRRIGRCPFQTFNDAMAGSTQQTLSTQRAQALATDADSGADNPMGIPASVYRAAAERADKVLEAATADTSAQETK